MTRILRAASVATLVALTISSSAQVDIQGDATTFSEADTTGKLWVKGGVFSINMNQVSLTNWSAGGQNSLGGIAQINAFANRKKGRKAWDNSLVLAIGGVQQGDADIVKTDDRMELNSKYGYQLKEGGNLFLAGIFQFKSQFTEGFTALADGGARISNFMAPGYFTLGLGLDYKPNENLSIFFAPATARIILVQDQVLADAGQFGVEGATFNDLGAQLTAGETSVFQFGGFLKAQYQKENLLKNVNFLTRFDAFSNYLENPGNIDIAWETLWTLKVNTWLAASVNTLLLYDDDITLIKGNDENGIPVVGPGTQFKEAIGVGLTFTF